MTGKQIKAIKQINQKRREIIWHNKVAMELKKAKESYKHEILECEKQKCSSKNFRLFFFIVVNPVDFAADL